MHIDEPFLLGSFCIKTNEIVQRQRGSQLPVNCLYECRMCSCRVEKAAYLSDFDKEQFMTADDEQGVFKCVVHTHSFEYKRDIQKEKR